MVRDKPYTMYSIEVVEALWEYCRSGTDTKRVKRLLFISPCFSTTSIAYHVGHKLRPV